MKVKETCIFNDLINEISIKEISIIEIENIDKFVKSKEDVIGTRNINIVRHEIYGGVSHKLTIVQNNIVLLEDSERMVIYEWEE